MSHFNRLVSYSIYWGDNGKQVEPHPSGAWVRTAAAQRVIQELEDKLAKTQKVNVDLMFDMYFFLGTLTKPSSNNED